MTTPTISSVTASPRSVTAWAPAALHPDGRPLWLCCRGKRPNLIYFGEAR